MESRYVKKGKASFHDVVHQHMQEEQERKDGHKWVDREAQFSWSRAFDVREELFKIHCMASKVRATNTKSSTKAYLELFAPEPRFLHWSSERWTSHYQRGLYSFFNTVGCCFQRNGEIQSKNATMLSHIWDCERIGYCTTRWQKPFFNPLTLAMLEYILKGL